MNLSNLFGMTPQTPKAIYDTAPSARGYWRGGGSEAPLAGGQGSGYGLPNQGVGLPSAGTGPTGWGEPAPAQWTPDIWFLVIMVVAEIVVFSLLGRVIERMSTAVR